MEVSNQKPLFVFIDESGDFNFSAAGSKFYTLTAQTTFFPNEKLLEMEKLRQDIIQGRLCSGLEEKYLKEKLSKKFHATEDKQSVRNLFFSEICQLHSRAYSIVLRKKRMNPSLYPPEKFYPQFMGYLLDYIFKANHYSRLEIIVSGMPISKNKEAFKKAVKENIASKGITCPYNISYPSSESSIDLQIVDYINWAIFRAWEKSDARSYMLIEHMMGAKELDVFKKGNIDYY